MTRTLRNIQLEQQEAKKLEHKQTLAEKFGLVGHPKLNLLYQKAWEHGHANGFSEVEFWFEDFAELLEDEKEIEHD